MLRQLEHSRTLGTSAQAPTPSLSPNLDLLLGELGPPVWSLQHKADPTTSLDKTQWLPDDEINPQLCLPVCDGYMWQHTTKKPRKGTGDDGLPSHRASKASCMPLATHTHFVLCSPGCPGICSVDQAGLGFRFQRSTCFCLPKCCD